MTIEKAIKNTEEILALKKNGAFCGMPGEDDTYFETVLSALRAQQAAEDISGNIADAIQDVQDMIDVLDVGGSAYVYRNNGGRERLWNILSCLKEKVQKCREIGFGSCDCYVSIPGYAISCDKCLATEIRMLNDMGIRTVGCCCGHQKAQGYIQVAPEYVEKMVEVGYEQIPETEDGQGKWCFKPKSVLLGKE